MKKSLLNEYLENGKFASCKIFDLHGHMGSFRSVYFPLSEPEKMIKEMERSGVDLLVFSHHAALLSPDTGNEASIEVIRRFPGKFLAYWSVNPNYQKYEGDIREFSKHSKAFVGFKFLPSYHKVSLAHSSYQPFWEFANSQKLIVLSHTWGGNSYDGERVISEVAERYPDVNLILGHSIHGAWEEAVSIAKDFPNLYLDLCAVLDERGILEYFVEEVGSERILFGTDFPWFSYPYYIGAVLGADITEQDRENVFYRNGAKLFKRRGLCIDQEKKRSKK